MSTVAFCLPPPVRRRYLRAYKAPSTTVEESLQISSFIQNKPNFPDAQMNVTSIITVDYENIANCKLGENKANTKPNKANLLNDQMNVNKVLTKDYENERLRRRGENKPKQTQFQRQKMLPLMTINGRRNSFGYYADKIDATKAGACPPTVEPGREEIFWPVCLFEFSGISHEGTKTQKNMATEGTVGGF